MRSKDNEHFEGFIEYLSAERVAGWTFRKGTLAPISVSVLLRGVVIGHVTADISRQDLKDSDKGSGSHGFNFFFPTPVQDFFQSDVIEVRVKDTQYKLEPTEDLRVILDAAAEFVPDGSDTHSQVAMDPVPSPFVETDSKGGSAGLVRFFDDKLVCWARLRGPGRLVIVTVDGWVVGEAVASGLPKIEGSNSETDLSENGFEIAIPASMLTGELRRVMIYDAETGAELSVEPMLFKFSQSASVEGQRLDPSISATNLLFDEPINKVDPVIGGKVANRRVTVVAWDMAHNPVGRAYLLADMLKDIFNVQLVGPTFAFYGGTLWPPIASTSLSLKSFPATDMKSLVEGALEMGKSTNTDIVIIGKPRLPSLLIGFIIAYCNNCPVIIDVDDHELAFTKNPTPLSIAEVSQLLAADMQASDPPYNDMWTRLCETFVEECDGVIVSNVALRTRFGGLMVRHGRDEAIFDPALYDRRITRKEFGYNDEDRVILFLGTPRPHKGIFALADALERLNDRRLVLCIIGDINDKRVASRFSSYVNARIDRFPDQSWSRLPELVNMADLVGILQDADHPIADYQIPAKLTDALAMNIRVVASPVAPLVDLISGGVVTPISSQDELDAVLVALVSEAQKSRSFSREAFLSEFSYGVNQARLSLAIESAFKTKHSIYPKMNQLFRLIESITLKDLPRLVDQPPRMDRRSSIARSDKPRDLIFLWKQNDSDIYGRRSDMICKYLLEVGLVNRIIHFDAPISISNLERQAAEWSGEAAHQGNLIYVNTIKRILRAADSPRFIKRTFLHRSGRQEERAFGRALPSKDGYGEFIKNVLSEYRVDDAPILWVSPVVFDYQLVADICRPSLIIADLIDDQRTFPGDSDVYRNLIEGAYTTILKEADKIFCNCVPIQEAFSALRSDITVVPNGLDEVPDLEAFTVHPELLDLPRPILGYVGNLRDRVNFSLLEELSSKFPHATIVLVGSAHGRPEVASIAARRPNIRLLGVRPYHEARQIIRSFDVALMPHVQSDQSERMNPLKLYVYFSLRIPIVTSAVANISDLEPYIEVAQDQDDFIEMVQKVLTGRGKTLSSEGWNQVCSELSWKRRVSDIWQSLEVSNLGA